MNCLPKSVGKLAVATGAATALLISALTLAPPSRADAPPSQDPTTGEAKVEVIKKVAPDVPKEAVKGADATAKVGKNMDVNITIRKAVGVPNLMVAPGAAFPAGNLEQMNRQMIQQLRPILRTELRLLTSVADPTPTQRTEIAIEAGRTLKEVAGKMAGFQNNLNQGVRTVLASTEPRKQIRDAIEASAKSKLSPEQFARYRKELDGKIQDRREAVVLNLVANIDKLLALSTEQRARLCDSFRSHWDDRDYPTLELSVTYDAYFPSIPDQHIGPILTEEQRKIWRGVRKINFSALRNSNVINNNNGRAIGPDEDEEDADVKAALAEEAKK
jgi:hypothetical protein